MECAVLMPEALLLPLSTLDATQQLAQRLAAWLRAGDVVTLQGEVGAGKTTLARALIHALGVTGDVPSPTFTLVQSYDTAHFPLHHFDLYRLTSVDELDEIGWDDALADGAVLIEWPERAARRLPRDRLELCFVLENGVRQCTITTYGKCLERPL